MAFPRKFKERLELELDDLEQPDYLWVVYAVCGAEKESCGWEGWILDGVFANSVQRYPTGTGDKLLPHQDQKCAECGRQLFRTGAELRFEKSVDQTPVHGVPGVDYEVEDMDYDDE